MAKETEIGGYITLHRAVMDHWIFEKGRKKTKFEAWLYLLFKARFTPTKEPIGFDLITIERGQLLTSQDKLSKAWGWDRSATKAFLKMLTVDNMLTTQTTTKYTMITICKYDSYQLSQPTKQQQLNSVTTSTQHQDNSDKKGNKDKIKEAYASTAEGKKYLSLEPTVENINNFIRTETPQHPIPYVEYWNLFAQKHGFPEVIEISEDRKRKLKTRLSSPSFNFLRILYKAKDSDMLKEGKWFTFDWIIANGANYLKVLEGNYDNKGGRAGQATESNLDKWNEVLKKQTGQ